MNAIIKLNFKHEHAKRCVKQFFSSLVTAPQFISTARNKATNYKSNMLEAALNQMLNEMLIEID